MDVSILIRLKDNVKALTRFIPSEVYVSVIFIFVVGVVFALYFMGKKKGTKLIALLMVVEYFFLVICSTVICRTAPVVESCAFTPFWTYREIAEQGGERLIREILLNVILFLPIGFTLCITFGHKRWKNILFAAFAASCFIELLQLLSRRGLCEIDDVIHNTIGCALGILVYFCFVKLWI